VSEGDIDEIQVNAALLKIIGYSKEEFFKLGIKGITHPDDWPLDWALFSDLVAGKIDHYKIEKRYLKKDGSIMWARLVVSMGKDVPGKPPFLFSLVDDITELKNMIDETKTALNVRDEFLAIASHELKTPLTPVKMLIYNLKKNLESTLTGNPKVETMKKLVQNADNQIDRLMRLIDDLLDVSRISRNRIALHPEEFDLYEVFHEIAHRYESELNKAGCTLIFNDHHEVKGKWDRLRMEQVLVNLLSNAIKYGAGKQIEITISKQDARATLIVRDHGIGINKADQERIFTRYTRAVPLTNYGGLGLGLFITRQIVEAHQGSIRVESELGKGAAFIVELPLETKECSNAFPLQ